MGASRSNRLAASENHGGDLILVQGHSSPGIYARAPFSRGGSARKHTGGVIRNIGRPPRCVADAIDTFVAMSGRFFRGCESAHAIRCRRAPPAKYWQKPAGAVLHQLPPIFRTNLIPNPRPGDGRVLNSRQQPRPLTLGVQRRDRGLPGKQIEPDILGVFQFDGPI